MYARISGKQAVADPVGLGGLTPFSFFFVCQYENSYGPVPIFLRHPRYYGTITLYFKVHYDINSHVCTEPQSNELLL